MGPIRQRKALSCVDCRRRKVKCDRTLPVCIRCQKSGNAEKCMYIPLVGGPNKIPTPSDDGLDQHQDDNRSEDIDQLVTLWQREDGFHRAPVAKTHHGEGPVENKPKTAPTEKELLARVIELETYVRSAGHRPVSAEMMFGIGNPMGPGYQADRNPMSDYDKVMVRGKSFSTQYFGPSFPISLLLQFDDLSKFVKDVLTMVPSLEEAKNKMAVLRAQSRKSQKSWFPHDQGSLLRMVPDRKAVDPYVQHYLETIETTHRILHVPSFLREYEELWKAPMESRPDFIAQLLLVIATVYCIVPGGPPGYVGRSSARREVASRWIAGCESWVDEQSKKHMTLSHLQIHVLIFMAKVTNCVKIKRVWENSGTLVRIAMAAGMHREPSLLARKISVFDCEMRRRLWFTILELDLDSTLNRGMTPTLDSFGYDALPPLNIHDEEFDEATELMPSSRPKTEWTRTSFLHCLCGILPIRFEILGRINSIRLVTDLEIVMQYDNKLRKLVDELPTWKTDAAGMLADRLIRLILWEFILILHIPLAGQTPHKSRFLYSVASKRDAAIKCLRTYLQLPDILRLHLSNVRDDLGRAALSMCHDLVTNVDDDPIANHQGAFEHISCVVNVLGERVKQLGQGFHGYWITVTAYALTRWKLSGEESQERFAKEAGAHVVNLFYDSLLDRQVAMPSLNGSVVDESMTSPSGASNRNAGGGGSSSVDDVFSNGFDGMTDQVDPMWDFMNFDFGSVWHLDPYPDF